MKVFVDKWFVNKGYGFGRAPTGEIVVIHASAVHGAEFFFIRASALQGAELLTIGTDALVQVENDDGRAQEGGREGQGKREDSGPRSQASSGTDCRAGSSVRKEGLCGVRPYHLAFVESSLRHID